ncbi:unnamed protein product [Polarella glacialis]|uniref:Uncharacterized protein n=1 Tax=Polarella glacialis TaxID=89957 RepID=A0A813IKJ8_POLGL|nr:unnamed protein product [Polarella glacialis]
MGLTCSSACASGGGSLVDDDEVLLFVRRRAADSEVKNWKTSGQIIEETEEKEVVDQEGQDEQHEQLPSSRDQNVAQSVDLVDRQVSNVSSRNPDGCSATKEAIARVVRAFVRGCCLEASSSSISTRRYLVHLDRGLTQLTLQDEGDELGSAAVVIPLVRVLEVSPEVPPGAGRYSFGGSCAARLRLGPHGGRGPDVLRLQLRSLEECDAFVMCIRACARNLQQEAAWEPRLQNDSFCSGSCSLEASRKPLPDWSWPFSLFSPSVSGLVQLASHRSRWF